MVKLYLGLREMWRDPYFSYTTIGIRVSLEKMGVRSGGLFDDLWERFLIPSEGGFGGEIKAGLEQVLGVRSAS